MEGTKNHSITTIHTSQGVKPLEIWGNWVVTWADLLLSTFLWSYDLNIIQFNLFYFCLNCNKVTEIKTVQYNYSVKGDFERIFFHQWSFCE